jgi:hypothetical protein
VRRLAVAWLLAIATAGTSAPASAHKCAVVDVKVPASRIDVILGAADRDQQTDLLLDLVGFWRAHCGDGRERADAAVVEQLSRLLDLRDARFLTASMLIDVGANLPAARAHIDDAYADERRFYERDSAALASNFPAFDALNCIREKLVTGQIDKEICGELLSARNAT